MIKNLSTRFVAWLNKPSEDLRAISPDDYIRQWAACASGFTFVAALYDACETPLTEVSALLRDESGRCYKDSVELRQVEGSAYWVDSAGKPYRRGTTAQPGSNLIQPLYMGMVDGNREFQRIFAVLREASGISSFAA